MNTILKIIVFLSVNLTGYYIYAHPVNFAGAYGFSAFNTTDSNELTFTYSATSRFAFGYSYYNVELSEFSFLRTNFLLKRWNKIDSQANIYLGIGAGYEFLNDESNPANIGEVSADWESRRYYILGAHSSIQRSDNFEGPSSYTHTKLRLGHAPYLGDFEDLSIWFMVQMERHQDAESTDVTPFLRFYFKNVLWEIGTTINKGMLFNFMVHI